MFLSTVANTLRIVWELKKASVRAQLEYRFTFLFQMFALVFNDTALIVIWALFFQTFPALNGWDLSKTFLFLSIVWGGTVWLNGITGGVFDIPELIVTGELDAYLTHPVHPLLYICARTLNVYELGTSVCSIAMWGYVQGFGLASLSMFAFLSCISGIIFFSYYLMAGCLSFYVPSGEFNFVYSFSSSFFNLAYFPQTIMPRSLKVITTFILPLFFIGMLPMELSEHFEWGKLFLFIGFAVVSFIASISLFNNGLKKYESGNLMQIKN